MKITPWDIYWILQLDSISTAAAIVFVICSITAILLLTLSPIIYDEVDELKVFIKRGIKWPVLFGVPAFFVVTLTPSSKTAAAMVVLPAIVNNTTIQREAGDLYALAKDALREAVKPDSKGK